MANLHDIQFSLNQDAQKAFQKLGKEISGVVIYDPAAI